MRLLVPLAVRRSDRVIAISQSSRRDVEELLGTPPERIDVVPQGVGAVQRAQPAPAAEVRASLALGDRRILLSLSARRPHKNLGALIDALAQIPVERRPVLVLPGYPTWQDAELAQRAERLGVAEDVRITGWLSEEQVEGLWQLADAFVFPSLYEGFGLPVLEAMARGVPVASSNAASLPEVAGDAALLFDPHDQRAIVAAVLRILDDPAEAQRLRLAGREQAGRFTWQRTAQGTLASYARALRLDGPPASWAQARGSTPGAAGATASA
jgi:glycosyltransferase involved in cell wall biosynthesis